MKLAIVLSSIPLVALLSGSLEAQSPLTVELRGGASIPASSSGDASLSNGAGFEVSAAFRVMPHLQVFGGYDWRLLSMEGATPTTTRSVNVDGFAFGLLFIHPLRSGINAWVRGGGFYDHLEISNSSGAVLSENDRDLGWEAGLGLHLPLNERFAVTPAVRYRSLSADVGEGLFPTPYKLGYVVLDVGISAGLGLPRLSIPVF